MKIALYYAAWPMSIGRYWKRAMLRRGHEVVSIGPYSGGSIPWPGNPDLSRWKDEPTLALSEFRNEQPITGEIASAINDCDLLVNVDAAYSLLGRPAIPKVIIGSDPHCINYDRQRLDCDMFVCMQKNYAQRGDVWIPFAYDPEWHVPVAGDPVAEVGFVGVAYDERKAELAALEQRGISTYVPPVGLIGPEYAQAYSNVRFAYCRSSQQDLCARWWEGLAMGKVVVQNYIRELPAIAEEFGLPYYDAITQYHDVEEMASEIKRVAASPDAYQHLVSEGRNWVYGHTWDRRVDMLLLECRAKGLL